MNRGSQKEKIINEKNNALIASQLKLEAKHKELKWLNAALEKSNDKIETLRDDKNFFPHEKPSLEGQLKHLMATLERDRLVAS